MTRSDNITAAMLMMASMAAFTFNDALMKMLAGQVPLYQLIFIRGVLTTSVVAVVVWRKGVLRRLPPRKDLWLILLRVIAEVSATFFFLTALFNMPIANVTAILQALPLTITLAAALFLREPVGWRRLLAIGVGLIGVMLIVRPGASDFTVYSLFGLGAVICVTIRDLATRRLSPEVPSLFVMFVTSVTIMVVFGVLALSTEWVVMDGANWGVVLAAAVFILGGYLFSIMVMRLGDIGFVAPFRYTGLIWALLLGLVIFGEWPDRLTMLGALIVVASGVFMLYREAVVMRRAAKTSR